MPFSPTTLAVEEALRQARLNLETVRTDEGNPLLVSDEPMDIGPPTNPFTVFQLPTAADRIVRNPDTGQLTSAGPQTLNLQSTSDVKQAQKKQIMADRNARPGIADRTSYSGCDIKAIANARGKLKVFADLQTLSYSIHREKVPVRTLGRSYAKGYTRGSRTIAGTLVFTVFDRSALWEVIQTYRNDRGLGPERVKTPLVDQLPPFDITVLFDNEYGHHSVMRLYGVEISDEGQTHSVDDMIVENVMQYVARDIDLMAPSQAEAWGPDGKVLYNKGLFLADPMGEARVDTYQQLQIEIGKLQKLLVSADAMANAEYFAELKYALVQLQAKADQVASGKNLIRRQSLNDGTAAYDIPFDNTQWSQANIVGE